jgi:TRAP-type C4-dicarboxylate transport system permease small subunit
MSGGDSNIEREISLIRFIKSFEFITVLLMVLVTITVCLQIVSRFIFPITWSEEFAKICLMWMVYISFMSSFYHNTHVRIDLIDSWTWIPKKVKSFIDFFFYEVCGIIFSIFLIRYSVQLFQSQFDKGQVTSILQWPFYIIVTPFILGGVLTLIAFVQKIVAFYNNHKKTNAKKEEVQEWL